MSNVALPYLPWEEVASSENNITNTNTNTNDDRDDDNDESESESESGDDNDYYTSPYPSSLTQLQQQDIRVLNWEEGYQLLKGFHKRHGTSEVPLDNRQYRDLYHWIWGQRKSYKHKMLSKDQCRRLESIGFAWNQQHRIEFDDDDDDDNNNNDEHTSGNSNHSSSSKHHHNNDTTNDDQSMQDTEDSVASIQEGEEETEDYDADTDALVLRLRPTVNHRDRRDTLAWVDNYQRLRAFKKQKGHMNITLHGHKFLYNWCRRQRYRFRDQKLTEDRIQLLDDLGFWGYLTTTAAANQEDVVMEDGNNINDATIDALHGDDGDRSKRSKARGGSSKPAEVEEEEDSDSDDDDDDDDDDDAPEKVANPKYEARWLEKFSLLKAYKKKYGHLDIPSTGSKLTLYTWTVWQRRMYRENRMSKNRKRKMNKLGFIWRPADQPKVVDEGHQHASSSEEDDDDEEQPETKTSGSDFFHAKWMKSYDKLKGFHKKFGHINVPANKGGEYEFLYFWLLRQRKQVESNEMSEERMKLLEKAGLIQDGSAKVAEVAAAVESEVDSVGEKAQALIADFDGYDSGVSEISIEDEGEKEHSELVIEDEGKWIKRYGKLKKYHRKYKCVTVPHRSGDGFESLALWCMKQRRAFDAQKLPSHRERKLDKLGFYWGTTSGRKADDDTVDSEAQQISLGIMKVPSQAHEKKWREMYDNLVDFNKRYGTLDIRSSDSESGYKTLYTFVVRMRRLNWERTLPSERKQLLDNIGFAWQAPTEPRKHIPAIDGVGEPRNETQREDKQNQKPPLRGGSSEQQQLRWMESYHRLKKIKEKYGTMAILFSDTKRKVMYNWILRQRRLKRDKNMPADRFKLLDDMDFDWVGGSGDALVSDGIDSESGSDSEDDQNDDGDEKTEANDELDDDDDGDSDAGSVGNAIEYEYQEAAVAPASGDQNGKSFSANASNAPMDLGKVGDLKDYLEAVELQIQGKKNKLGELKRKRVQSETG